MASDKTLNKLTQAIRIIDLIYRYKQYVEEIPAMAVGIIYKNKVLFSKGYGFTDKDKKIPTTEKTCFRIASISKIFTAISIMQLAEAKKINLDEKVATYLSWFNSTVDSKLKEITIRQLLTHTSSLTRDGNTFHWTEYKFPDIKYIKKYVSQLKLPFPPHSRWKYSNFGFSILGALIEEVSGKTYEKYIQDNICQKLNMTLTSSQLTKNIKKNLAVGWGRKLPGKNRELFPNIETNAMASATGLSSNISDLLKFVSVQFIGNSALLSEKSKEEIRKLYWVNKKDGIKQAIGFRVYKSGGKDIYYHSGGFQGYRCNISFDIKRSIGIITLTNVLGIDPKNYAMRFFDVINYIDKKPFIKNDEKLIKYEGIYRDIWNDDAIIVLGNNLLCFDPNSLQPLSHASVLSPVKKDVFLIKGSDEVEMAGELSEFQVDKKGQQFRWGAGYSYRLIL